MTALISPWSICVRGTVLVILRPPLSFFLKVMLGGSLLMNSEALEFRLDYPLVCKRLVHIQHNED
jgi:hypothetical protein